MIVLWAGVHIGLKSECMADLATSSPTQSDHRGNWVGIFLNRNIFTPVAVLGLMTSIALAVTWTRSAAGAADLGPIAAMTFAVVADLKLALGGGSRGSLGFAAADRCGCTRCRIAPPPAPVTISGPCRSRGRCRARGCARCWLGAPSNLDGCSRRRWGAHWSSCRLGRGPRPMDTTPVSWVRVLVAVGRPVVRARAIDAGIRPLIYAHNSYLEMLLGAGIVALLLCLLVVILAWGRVIELAWWGVTPSTCGRSRSSRTASCWDWWRPRHMGISCSGPYPSGRSPCGRRDT